MSKDKATISVVILAAGESKRFGSPKQLAEFDGDPMLVSVIKQVLACGIEPFIALGANLDVISQHAAMLPFQHLIMPVKNWSLGISESIKESVSFLKDGQSSGIVFLLADQPLIDSAYLMYFLNRVQESPLSLICTEYEKSEGDSVGVPAYFPREYFEKLSLLEGDQGAKKILKNHTRLVLKCKGKLFDVDEPEDLAHARLML